MRIAIVGPFPPFRGGIVDLNSAFAYRLSKKYNVQVFNITTQYPKALFQGKIQFKNNKKVKQLTTACLLNSMNSISLSYSMHIQNILC